MAYEAVGKRMRERLLAQGYKRDDGEPDVQRFGWDHRFDKGHLYAWLREEMTPFKDLIRLCAALDCSAEWLLTGEERKKAAPGRTRPHIKSLLLVLAAGSALGLWPSGSASGQAQAVGHVESAGLQRPSYRKRRSLLSLGLVPA